MKKRIMNVIAATITLVLSLIIWVPVAKGQAITDIASAPYSFNSNAGGTTITYTLNDVTAGHVSLEIYNSSGGLARTIDDGIKDSGTYSVLWDGRDSNGLEVAEGGYTLKLTVSSGSSSAANTYTFVLKWGVRGSADGQFNHPEDVEVDSSGNVYVVDFYNNRIQKFSAEGRFIAKWGSYGSGDGQFYLPTDMAIDSSGNVYVVDNYRVQKFSPDGRFITKWGSRGNRDGQFNYPIAVAVDLSGNVYVTDRYNYRVQKFTSDGRFITKWGSYGSGDGRFNDPINIEVDSSGYVYVADKFNHRIQKFTSDGRFVAKWGSFGTGDGQFHYPVGLAIDLSGNVYVSDFNNYTYERYDYRIQKFTPDGRFITKWGTKGSADGQFNYADDMAIDSSGYVYVADKFNYRIQKFSPSGSGINIARQTNVLVDNTPPELAVTLSGIGGDGLSQYGWYNTGVLASFTATDSLSGVDSVTPDIVISTEGKDQAITGTAIDRAGNSASITSTVNIDKTPPVLSILTPADGAEYVLNQPLTADWSGTDTLSGVVSLIGTSLSGEPLDTSTVGEKTFSAVSIDRAGNRTAQTSTYYVRYSIGGIKGGSTHKLGSTIPIKFQLIDFNGNYIPTAVARLYLAKTTDGIPGPEIPATSTSNAVSGNLFRYDSTDNQYIFNLSTKTLSVGNWQLRISLDDGTSKYLAVTLR